MADKPKINMRIQSDKSTLFDAREGITVRVSFDSPTQVKVEMWRDSDMVVVPPDVGNIGSKSFRERLARSAREVFTARFTVGDPLGGIRHARRSPGPPQR